MRKKDRNINEKEREIMKFNRNTDLGRNEIERNTYE